MRYEKEWPFRSPELFALNEAEGKIKRKSMEKDMIFGYIKRKRAEI